MLLKTQWEYLWNQRRNQKIPQDQWKWTHSTTKSMGWEIHSDTDLSKETRKISNKQPNLPPKRIR